MEALNIARRMVQLDKPQEAVQAYTLALHNGGLAPEEELEAALCLLQLGGSYKAAYTAFLSLYNRGCFREDCLSIMTEAFYSPNVKLLKSRYEKNCKALGRYPYLFRKDFPAFEDLPLRFYPFDDASYLPFDTKTGEFGDYWKPSRQVVSRNFFKDLENPILAKDVYSQYELEYLYDNVRPSEWVARENHIYLHYTDWGVFCSYLQCLNLRRLLEKEKIVFLIGDEIGQYPINFKERFGIDYSQNPVKPFGIREVQRMIWHTQLASHNGGDFFNEIFDSHPNLLAQPSIMFFKTKDKVKELSDALGTFPTVESLIKASENWDPRLLSELFRLKDRTDKDLLVAILLNNNRVSAWLDRAARIAPAVFFQPHFGNIYCDITQHGGGRVTVHSPQLDEIHQSPLFNEFKYIKTFTPIRRITTSYGAAIKFMLHGEEKGTVRDELSERLLNRSYMIDPEDRLYMDSRLVRFEDGKLNPKATFTALAAFLDLPYTESMTYCSLFGERDPESLKGNDLGFSPAAIYRTYDEYANDDERYYLEYFLRSVYRYCGYEFHYYDGAEVDEERVKELISGFTTLNSFIADSWIDSIRVVDSESEGDDTEKKPASDSEVKEYVSKTQIEAYDKNRLKLAKILMENPFFMNKNGQPLHMMPKLELDPALLEQPLYH